jgi:hypothetical protein
MFSDDFMCGFYQFIRLYTSVRVVIGNCIHRLFPYKDCPIPSGSPEVLIEPDGSRVPFLILVQTFGQCFFNVTSRS